MSSKVLKSIVFFISLLGGLFAVAGSSSAATSRWIASGSGTNTLAYSDNGINWTPVPNSTDIFFTQGYKIAYNGEIFVAVGGGTGSVNSIAYSRDGINWTPAARMVDIFSAVGTAVAWNGSRWVAVGQGTNNTIAYSDDGIHWTPATDSGSIFSPVGYSVIWTGTRWLAGGNGINTIAYSDDGIDWTPVTGSTSIFSATCRAIACNATRCVAVGGNTTNSLAYSDDGGLSWIGIGKSIFSTAGYGIAWNGSLWVATGGGTNSIAYSSNGIDWIPVTGSMSILTAALDIAWNGSLWVATGSGTNSLAYSSNGIDWTPVSDSMSVFSTRGSRVGSAPAPNLIPAVGGIMIDAPGSLAATPGLTSVDLSWTTPTDNGGLTITDYEVKYRTGSGSFVAFSHTASAATSITITGLTPNTSYDFTVAAIDADGAGRTASVSSTTNPDTTAPVITLTGSSSIILTQGETYADAGATATDNIDGNLTSSITVVNPVNTNLIGTYTITYNVSDAASNAATQVARTVKVVSGPSLPTSFTQTPEQILSATGQGTLSSALKVNGNTPFTATSRKVSLTFNNLDKPLISRLAISSDSDFTNDSLINYTPVYEYDLCGTAASCPNGKYTVYARYYTVYGQHSQTISLDITLKQGIDGPALETTSETAAAEKPLETKPVDKTLSSRLSGHILLQVESHGEAWYINPNDQKRYYLKDGAAAYELMRSFGLGITNTDLEKIPTTTDQSNSDPKLVSRLSGRILLQVESHGEAWYVDPKDGARYYLANGDAAYELMRSHSLEITNENLEKIGVGEL